MTRPKNMEFYEVAPSHMKTPRSRARRAPRMAQHLLPRWRLMKLTRWLGDGPTTASLWGIWFNPKGTHSRPSKRRACLPGVMRKLVMRAPGVDDDMGRQEMGSACAKDGWRHWAAQPR